MAFLAASVVVFQLPDYRPSFDKTIGPEGPVDAGLSGREVAQRYCANCHLEPDPAQLPKETWPFVVTWMGNYLGYKRLHPPYGHITAKHLIPPDPLVSREEMTRLGRFFLENAPPAAEFLIERDVPPPLDGFRATRLEGAGDDGEVVTLLHIDEERGHLFVATANDKRLRVFNRALELELDIKLDNEAMHVAPRDRGFRLTLAGDYARNKHRGRIVEYDFTTDEWDGLRQRTLAAGLHRTLESHSADLDGDGREDLVVVSFGDGVGPGYGKVSVLWATEQFEAVFDTAPAEFNLAQGTLLPGAFEEQVLLDRAGALGAQVVDLDGDGRLDVVVLATQGTSELVAYLMREDRRFERHVIESQHVSFGYNQFQARDFDGDGHVDLLIVNGNNMELKNPPLRPYHGVRVLLGEPGGELAFREVFSFPMYGALTALAEDLDGDGDVDLAVNAFYPNWFAEEPETFTVLENRGDWTFEARTLGGEHWGRWLRIAAGDLDGDGRAELFLGSGNTPGGGLHPDRPRQWERYRRKFAQVPAVLRLEPSPGP